MLSIKCRTDEVLSFQHVFLILVSVILVGSILGSITFIYCFPFILPFDFSPAASTLHTLLLTAIPLILSVLSAWMGLFWISSVILFLKFFAFSFCICWVCALFPDSAWLVRFLILFVDFCTLPVLVCFVASGFAYPRRNLLIAFTFCALFTACAVFINDSYILTLLEMAEIL